jgi:uroporphyrin-III C-methyltransferase
MSAATNWVGKAARGPVARVRRPGKVLLVGAGPGDPELLTVRAHRLLTGAEVVAYDELVGPAVLALAPAGAERIAVGRRKGAPGEPVAGIHPAVIERALAGIDVVRLKGGDPLVFGRGGEEAEALTRRGIPFEIVPGVSAALGAAASVGIPLTHREVASSVTFVTAHLRAGELELAAVTAGPPAGTLVVYMGLTRLEEVVSALVVGGRAPATPAAVVSRATLPDERTVIGDLATIAAAVREAKLETPALLIVGEVVARRVVSTIRIELELAQAALPR